MVHVSHQAMLWPPETSTRVAVKLHDMRPRRLMSPTWMRLSLTAYDADSQRLLSMTMAPFTSEFLIVTFSARTSRLQFTILASMTVPATVMAQGPV